MSSVCTLFSRPKCLGWRMCTSLSRSLFVPLSHQASCESTKVLPACRIFCSTSPPRPSLDDVERLSRGQPSKAKIGSRAVPHRLNEEERKAYELAKKRGYLVRKFQNREYPLSNTYRNFCDAVGWPNLRIDQRPAGSMDTIIVDLTTLRLEESDLAMLTEEIKQIVSVEFGSSSNEPQEVKGVEIEHQGKSNEATADGGVMLDLEDQKAGILRFSFLRSNTKPLTLIIKECCQKYTSTSTGKIGS
ncbi:hypothetical protein KP509_10G033300 [Ceratopteris richardii]|uniref:Uncharacterized protein n=1 Tax=Ceratopteris richardii TaxID=49495 RepID=A0A8T2U025_CERRI|nr:hypothetical protein KP509_10G033300 [Ceratopteris richardii]